MNNIPSVTLNAICRCILDESSSPHELRQALDSFVRLCGSVSDIHPDPSFSAWSDDALLSDGVAINPGAAAHCAVDYRRSVTFIRGVHAAMNALRLRFPDQSLIVLYAGCGPFATLLLPLLGRFRPGELDVTLLDVHQRSLDSVEALLAHFGLGAHGVRIQRDDACRYRHDRKLHLVIAETMQKSLEQEPQVAVTANLAPQLLPGGVFIPQHIEIELGLVDLEDEKRLASQSAEIASAVLARRRTLGTVFALCPETIKRRVRDFGYGTLSTLLDADTTTIGIPTLPPTGPVDAVLFTRVQVYERHRLGDYESEITLPRKCHELSPLVDGQRYRVSYQTGGYPRFHFTRLDRSRAALTEQTDGDGVSE